MIFNWNDKQRGVYMPYKQQNMHTDFCVLAIRFMCHKLQVIYTTALSIFFRVASLAPILVILKYMGQIEGYQTLDYYKTYLLIIPLGCVVSFNFRPFRDDTFHYRL